MHVTLAKIEGSVFRGLICAGLLLCTAAIADSPKAEVIPNDASINRYKVVDAHLHYVDFLQNSDGIQALLKSMNDAGVEHAMLNGLPVVKKWDAIDPIKPQYYLADDSTVQPMFLSLKLLKAYRIQIVKDFTPLLADLTLLIEMPLTI